MTQRTLTDRQIRALRPGEWASDPAARGAGRLQARKLVSGSLAWYYRYTAPDGKRHRQPIGSDLSLAAARAEADKLVRKFQAGARDLREVVKDEREREARERAIAAREAEEAAARQVASLGKLLTAYVAQLRYDGKKSARDVETTFARHVETPWEKLWAMPAADVTTDDLLEIVARVERAGKKREAAKLRSFLRAAYSAAINARTSASALDALRVLKIRANPARDLGVIKGSTTPGERALSLAELRAYWKRINAKGFRYGPMLRFHLLTGSQRQEMLARATEADIDPDAISFRLWDHKGRRSQPRVHDVPLIPAAMEALDAMRTPRVGPYLFTATNGASGQSNSTMRDAVKAVNKAMSEAGELTGEPFTASDLRRTVETRLSAAGVSMEDRGYLQSHGLGGVQARHYDRHKRLKETREALELLHKLATGKIRKRGAQ
ncbi:tyrosine-type recombinase/integrase [Luteimonas changyuni]|uniref:tyrosine-type recombinase/integrase n=1 Tax=Luteimonas sp. MJ145 TaxID=3129234 RepID=UPI0031BA01AC